MDTDKDVRPRRAAVRALRSWPPHAARCTARGCSACTHTPRPLCSRRARVSAAPLQLGTGYHLARRVLFILQESPGESGRHGRMARGERPRTRGVADGHGCGWRAAPAEASLLLMRLRTPNSRERPFFGRRSARGGYFRRSSVGTVEKRCLACSPPQIAHAATLAPRGHLPLNLLGLEREWFTLDLERVIMMFAKSNPTHFVFRHFHSRSRIRVHLMVVRVAVGLPGGRGVGWG